MRPWWRRERARFLVAYLQPPRRRKRTRSFVTLEQWGNLAEIIGLPLAVLAIGLATVELRNAAKDQRKARQYQAWQAVSGAQGKPGSGGRKTALEDLYVDGVPLVGVDLSGGAYLSGLTLPGADLRRANLMYADLSGAYLWGADLTGANLTEANLTGAYLRESVFPNAQQLTREQILSAADWRGAKLPPDRKDLELHEDASEEAMDRLGRTWKKPE